MLDLPFKIKIYLNLNQCQSQLRHLYQKPTSIELEKEEKEEKEELGNNNEAEFIAYRILYMLFTKNEADLTELISIQIKKNNSLNSLNSLNSNSRNSRNSIVHAIETCYALNEMDFVKYIALYNSTPNMGKFILDLFLDEVRIAIMKMITKTFRPSVNMKVLREKLAFTSIVETKNWIELHGGKFINDSCSSSSSSSSSSEDGGGGGGGGGGGEIDCKTSFIEFNKLDSYPI